MEMVKSKRANVTALIVSFGTAAVMMLTQAQGMYPEAAWIPVALLAVSFLVAGFTGWQVPNGGTPPSSGNSGTGGTNRTPRIINTGMCLFLLVALFPAFIGCGADIGVRVTDTGFEGGFVVQPPDPVTGEQSVYGIRVTGEGTLELFDKSEDNVLWSGTLTNDTQVVIEGGTVMVTQCLVAETIGAVFPLICPDEPFTVPPEEEHNTEGTSDEGHGTEGTPD